MTRSIQLRVPASTANLGPGYDSLGMALSLYLTPGAISLDPSKNLISRTLLDTLRAAHTSLPADSVLSIHIDNPIPTGAVGLGSSGSAVVAGVVLANWAAQLGWSRDKLLQHCVAIEGHPDNVAPSLLGGFVASVMSGGAAQGICRGPSRAHGATSRHVTHVLGNPNVHGKGTHLTKQALGCLLDDVVHQPYRMHLIPGFQQLKSALDTNPDVLGLCVSGAGPTRAHLLRT
ncbi:ribosomal protein S5 domain 2-type protein [Catenaria anguillulae PL171]|uniref:Ribosomal protein S5 domain 2-type protein n=1 Tax=Catenaria anguillulae PL171 TaxID=765915 RepID=A0A1Y2HA58_9FUNG|nr:ribosomal protein S5 domain 2-type protein [Catenaria anguillulae PL171]